MDNDEQRRQPLVAGSGPAIRTSVQIAPMKRALFLGAVAVCCLTGCRSTYVIRLTNSDTITARTRPRLDGHGYYVFKDADGKDVRINELRVREIEAK